MFGDTETIPHARRVIGREQTAVLRAAIVLLILIVGALGAAVALAADTPSGLPLPRFVTTRSDPVNVRVGPGTKYGVAWVYVKAGMPVEIIQEFDTWRKIRDVDGSEGWLHQNLLQGRRSGVVAPWMSASERIALRGSRDAAAGVRAWLSPMVRVDISECDGSWCKVTARPQGNTAQSFDGYMQQAELWGVYKDEAFD
jgi:SH3-like domain-containing protein